MADVKSIIEIFAGLILHILIDLIYSVVRSYVYAINSVHFDF
jgi:hypothetical protein